MRSECIEFFVPMETLPTATAQQRKFFSKGGHISTYLPKSVRNAKEVLKEAVLPHAPAEPLKGPVYVKIIWCFPYRKTEKKENIGKVIPKTTRPDTGNLNKSLYDIMTQCGYWTDDSLIVRGTEEKCWYKHSGLYIKVMEIDERFNQKIKYAVEPFFIREGGIEK